MYTGVIWYVVICVYEYKKNYHFSQQECLRNCRAAQNVCYNIKVIKLQKRNDTREYGDSMRPYIGK